MKKSAVCGLLLIIVCNQFAQAMFVTTVRRARPIMTQKSSIRRPIDQSTRGYYSEKPSEAEGTTVEDKQAVATVRGDRPIATLTGPTGSWFSYLSADSSAINAIESKYDAIMQKLRANQMPSALEIDQLLEASSKADYIIINKEDPNGITLLGYICKLFADTLKRSVKKENALEYKQIIDKCVQSGAVLSETDRMLLMKMVHVAKEFWSKWTTTEKSLSIGVLKHCAQVFDCFEQLGVNISDDVDVKQMHIFMTTLQNVEQSPYGTVSYVHSIGSGQTYDDTIEKYTINDIEKMINFQRISFIDYGINVIMHDLNKKPMLKDSDNITVLFGHENRQRMILPLYQLEDAAKKGTLRMTLLMKLKLKDYQQNVPSYKIGSHKRVVDIIYERLMESNKIELERLLNEYQNLCNAASFMKIQSSQKTFAQQRAYWIAQQAKSE